MKIVAGEGKKERNFGWSGGGESGERPNFGRTDENFEHTPHRHTTPQQQRHTTQHNGGSRTRWSWARGSLARRSMAQKKQDMSNKLSPPNGQGFLGSKMVRKGLATKRFDKKGAKRRSGLKVLCAKSGQKKKNMEKTNQKEDLRPKQKM